MEIQLEKLIEEVTLLARSVGHFLKEEQLQFRRDSIEQKHQHDYVSYVDREAERRIIEALRKLLPEAGFITEEGQATYQDEPYCWVVDPLDGTTNYVHGTTPYCVSIALRNANQLLLGVVYDPCLDECFTALLGKGAWLNGRPLQVSSVTTLEESFLITELPYNSDSYANTARHLVESLYGKVAGLRMNGSAALAICYVAAGRIDGWLEAHISRWDYSAAALLVLEAGGCVTDFFGNSSFIDGHHIVATNGHIHESLRAVVLQSLPTKL